MSWEEYFIAMAWVTSLRSEDINRRVGCVCANDENKIIGTGYNGLPSGINAPEGYWTSDDLRLATIMHSEVNALLRCPIKTVRTLACTCICCKECAKLAVNHGVKKVLYSTPYERDMTALDIFKFYKIECKQITKDQIKPYLATLL